MKILLFRSNNIFASRVNKYVNYYKRAGLDYTIIGWNRSGEAKDVEHYEFCQYNAKKNAGGIQAMKNHSMWMWFVFKYLKKHKDVTTIHACDLNVAFPAAVFKWLVKKDVVLIFDACDWFSDNFSKYPMLRRILSSMERFAYKHSDALIICEEERRAQIQFELRQDPFILPNIPEVAHEISDEDVEKRYVFNNDLTTIGYFGGFSKERFLPELLDLTKTGQFNLLIAGYGEPAIEEKCEEVKDLPNVRFFGRVGMEEGLRMSKHADIIYTMYCKSNPNHIFAAPNKYYEALMLGKPLLTTEGIIIADKVRKNDIGFVSEETKEDLLKVITGASKEEIASKGKNATRLWNVKYKTYVRDFFETTYSKIIK